MQDRVPLHPGRVKLTPVAGQENIYDLERQDGATVAGTPLNKASLLTDATCDKLRLEHDTATPDDALSALYQMADVYVTNITLSAAGWVGDSSPYTQPVAISAVTADSKVDVQPTDAAIETMVNSGTYSLRIDNVDGVCTAHAVGDKPEEDMTVQVTVSRPATTTA